MLKPSSRIYKPEIKAAKVAAQKAALRESERLPLLGGPIAQRSRSPITPPENVTAEDTANLAIYGVQHVLENNEIDREAVLCSKICKPKYIESSPIPQNFEVPSNVKNACTHRCHNWTKDQYNNYKRRKTQQALIETGKGVLKKTPAGPLVGAVSTFKSLTKTKGLKSDIKTGSKGTKDLGVSYGTRKSLLGGKSRKKRKSRRKRKSKSQKSRRKRKSKSQKSRRKR